MSLQIQLESDESAFDIVPFEVSCLILAHLSPYELCVSSTVCSLFGRIASMPSVWKGMCVKEFDLDVNSTGFPNNSKRGQIFDWRLYYREKMAFTTSFEWKSLAPFEPVPLEGQEHIPAPSPPRRARHGATAVDHRVVVTGGHVKSFTRQGFERKSDVWVYDTIAKSYEELTIQPSLPRISRHSLVTVGNMIYSFFGILQDKTKLNSVFILDLEEKTWNEVATSGTPPAPRNDSVVKAFGDDKVIVFGGSLEGLIFPSDVYVFDCKTHTWEQPEVSGTPPNTRISCAGAVLNDRLYVYGGGFWDNTLSDYTSKYHDLWSLDLLTWEWSQPTFSGDLPVNLGVFCSMITVGNHLLIDGGREYICRTDGVHLYDTIAQTWSKLAYVGFSPNANSSSCTVIGTQAYVVGYYPSFSLDLSPLDFVLKDFNENTE
eukprot:TRINITY_DN8828_c0_g1_i1.p1 TRINITY_DN8828_c0_g1~~TRINITY_DN8828_c0_g1_i1.p1  ORF type:complete len:444 (-),score=89.84 TRINITY_DN8828_c0_g1_i1:258-1547(-)